MQSDARGHGLELVHLEREASLLGKGTKNGLFVFSFCGSSLQSQHCVCHGLFVRPQIMLMIVWSGPENRFQLGVPRLLVVLGVG